MPQFNQYNYNHSPEGRIRSARYNSSEKHIECQRKWLSKHPKYREQLRALRDEVIGANEGEYWGLYKLFKGLPNATVVEVTV